MGRLRPRAALLVFLLIADVTTAVVPGAHAEPVASEISKPMVGVTADPCAAREPAPAVVAAYMLEAARAQSTGNPPPVPSIDDIAVYNAWQSRLAAGDFSGRCVYDSANRALSPATDHRIVFFGDSITQFWGAFDPTFFKDDTINRGVSGQTTSQMVGRFQADVVELHPKVVLILAGTNDIAGNTGPTSLAWIESNIQAMADLAKANHIKVVLGSVPPASAFVWRPTIHPIETITTLNVWLRTYAKAKGLVYADYYASTVDENGGFQKSLTGDGVHPNADGYRIMRPIAERAVRQALQP